MYAIKRKDCVWWTINLNIASHYLKWLLPLPQKINVANRCFRNGPLRKISLK